MDIDTTWNLLVPGTPLFCVDRREISLWLKESGVNYHALSFSHDNGRNKSTSMWYLAYCILLLILKRKSWKFILRHLPNAVFDILMLALLMETLFVLNARRSFNAGLCVLQKFGVGLRWIDQLGDKRFNCFCLIFDLVVCECWGSVTMLSASPWSLLLGSPYSTLAELSCKLDIQNFSWLHFF